MARMNFSDRRAPHVLLRRTARSSFRIHAEHGMVDWPESLAMANWRCIYRREDLLHLAPVAPRPVRRAAARPGSMLVLRTWRSARGRAPRRSHLPSITFSGTIARSGEPSSPVRRLQPRQDDVGHDGLEDLRAAAAAAIEFGNYLAGHEKYK